MPSPRRSLAIRTVFIVFIAVVCLSFLRSSPPRPPKHPNAAKSGEPEEEKQPLSSPSAVVASTSVESAEESPNLAKYSFATLWGREKDPRLAAFSKWATRYTHSPPTARAEMVAEGIALARERRPAFKNSIRTQPKAALAETVPAVVRNLLPESILALLEERVTGMGDLSVLGRTDATDGQAIQRRALINGREFTAYVYGARNAQKTSSNISLHGVALDGEIALSDSPLRVFEPGEPVPADKPLAADSCPISRQPTAPTKDGPRPNAVAAESGHRVYWMCHGKHVAAAADQITAQEAQTAAQAYSNVGSRSALVIMVDFSDLPGAPTAPTTVASTMQGIDDFLALNSYGDLHLPTRTITSTLRMPRTSRAYTDPNNTSGDSMLLSDARTAARNAGWTPDIFDFDLVAFVDIGFPWSGQGYVGAKGAWIQGSFAGATVGHELGHNLGVWHANSWDSSESPISPNGVHTEYGNPFDVMGRTVSGFPNDQYSANFKHLLGWLTSSNIATVNGSGTFRLYAHDQNSRQIGRNYALNIPVGIVAGDEIEDYWIDFRQALASQYPATTNGAIIQWGNESGTQFASRLLDMNYVTPTKTDAPLAIGQTFSDPDRGLQITPIAQGGSGADAYLDVEISLVAPPTVDLAEALDTTDLTWTTSAAPWTGQRNVTHDGVDAAASGPIRDNSESYIETTVTGPGALFFWWKVSSEENFDNLKFAVDSVDLASISGQVDWQQRGYEISAGAHTVRWTYSKDAGTTGGADRGWVDQVSFVTGPHGPFINTQPAPVIAGLGEAAEFHIDAIGSDPLTYQWQKIDDNGDPVAILGATNSTFVINTVQDSDAGLYNCIVQNPVGSLTSTNALLTAIRIVTLPDAVDNSDAAWSTSGAVGWTGQQITTHDGVDAAQSGDITDGKDSSLDATITGPGALSFWWKVSSEPDYDLLSLYLDGNLIESHSGEFDWTQQSITIPNGVHKVRWTYAKDFDKSAGADAAWVDEVQFTPTATAAPQFVSEPAPQSVSIGGAALFTSLYTATPPVTFTWFKDGAPLPSDPRFSGIHSDMLLVTNVQSSDVGVFILQISNPSGIATNSGAALTIVSLSLADALDQPQRAFLTGGDAPWVAQTTTTHDLADAAKAGLITDGEFTWIETHIAGPATVKFWWKVSSELGYDILYCEVDTTPVLQTSGENDWRQETVDLTNGDHLIRWLYRKDANTPGGQDTAWLDQVEIIPAAAPLEIANLTLDATGLVATVQSLPATGDVVLEASTNLTAWTPVSTNQISGATLTIHRATTNTAEFLRIKVQ